MTPNPISDAFEGENSSLRKTFEEAVDVPKWIDEKMQEYETLYGEDAPAKEPNGREWIRTTLLSVAAEAEARGRKAERERADRIVREAMDATELETNAEFLACDDLAIKIIKALNH